MEWLKDMYSFVEKHFFYTLTRKIIGNISFLCIVQICSLYFFYSAISAPNTSTNNTQPVLFFAVLVSLLTCAFTIFYLHHLIVKPVRALLTTLNDINHTQGDLSTRLPAFTCDEFSELSVAYNKFAANLSALIAQVHRDAQLANDANRTLTGHVTESYAQADSQQALTANISQAANSVSDSILTIVSASAQVSATNTQNQESAVNANDTLQHSQQQIAKISKLLSQFAATVNGLQKNAENVRNILTMVEGFADQTNLLALNAAIEAARAGEAGRGFAVVADEVRTLSAKVADATQQISNFLNQMDTLVSDTHKESSHLIEASDTMQNSIALTSETFTTMLKDFDENIRAFETIMISVNDLEQQQNNTVKVAEQITALSEEIQTRLKATSQEADKAQALAASTQQGLRQFVIES